MAAADYSMFDKMIEGVQVINHIWQYVYVNDALVRQSKKKKEDLIGHTMMDCYPGIEQTQVFNYVAKCMKAGLDYQVLNEFKFEDGTKGWFELRMHPVEDGVLIMSFDVTHQIRIEKELHKLNQVMESSTQERTSQLLDSLQKENELKAHKTAFLNLPTSGIHKSLNAILAAVSELESKSLQGNPGELQQHLSQIKTSTYQMVNAFNDMLTLERKKHSATLEH